MENHSQADRLRALIRRVGQTKVARKAGVSVATMSDFMTGKTQHFRADTQQRVLEAIEILEGESIATEMGSPELLKLISNYQELSAEQRQVLLYLSNQLKKK